MLKWNTENTTRPEKVSRAIMLLYITLIIGIVRGIMEESPYQYMVSVSFNIVLTLTVSAMILFLIYMIGKGKYWARFIWMATFVISVPYYLHLFMGGTTFTTIFGLLEIAQIILEIMALILLYQKPSSDWFRQMKSNI